MTESLFAHKWIFQFWEMSSWGSISFFTDVVYLFSAEELHDSLYSTTNLFSFKRDTFIPLCLNQLGKLEEPLS